MAKRKVIGAKLRFEVFKRDAFKCQYCGKAAPDVILRVDHVRPVSKGGDDDLLNLITACFECNAGKGAIELSDKSAIAKQRKQLEDLAERREQLDMMIRWRAGLRSINDDQVEHAAEAFSDLTSGAVTANENGRATLRKLIRKYGLADVLDAIEDAGEKYLIRNPDGSFVSDSAGVAFSKLHGICRLRRLPEAERNLLYIRGICRNSFDYCVEWECLKLLRNAYEAGADIEWLRKLSQDTRYWSTWKRWMYEIIEELRADREFEGWRDDPDLAAKRGARLGVTANADESLEDFVRRIDQALGYQ